jgi:hypothetical protein
MPRLLCLLISCCYLLAGCTQPQISYEVVPAKLSFDKLIGANVYEWNFQENFEKQRVPEIIFEQKAQWIDTLAWVRHYIDWDKIEAQPNQYTFNPTAFGGWNYDAIYQYCSQKNVQVLACIKGIPAWLQASYPANQRDLENIPAVWQAPLENPASYTAQAKMAFQFAARYGRTKVATHLLSVHATPRWQNDSTNKIATGLGTVQAMECDNERDKWWKGPQAQQTAEQYAANLSAYYDGHLGTLGKNVGVKNADPTMLVVMAGLAKPDTNFVHAMVNWCKKNRGYKKDGSVNLCFDVINYHYYANNTSSQQFVSGSKGVAPEYCSAAATATAFYALGKRLQLPVWLTETGYDVHEESAQGVPGKTAEQRENLRAAWLLRTCLLYYKTGIEKLALYQLWDDGSQTATTFATTGLVTKNKASTSLQAILGMAKILNGYRFVRQTVDKKLTVDKFIHPQKRAIWVAYLPSKDLHDATQKLNIPANAKVLVFDFAKQQYIFQKTMGSNTIDIGGMPVILLL